MVHIIDAEADSVGHYRRWLRTPGRLVIVRADDRSVQYAGKKTKFSQIMELLWDQKAFRRAGEITSSGGVKGQQWVAETTVTLTNPARPNRRNERSRRSIPGEPVTFRLILSQLRFDDGKVLVWFLLTNLPPDVDASQEALWYYWRWRIECYFKLLKSDGHHLEQWQQESGAAIARRLLVASAACVLVWQLQRDESPEGCRLRGLLVRLSGAR